MTLRAVRERAAALAACLLILATYAGARLPHTAEEEQSEIAARFRFETLPLPVADGRELRTVRAVNPSLKRIESWISSVGAGVALADVDGDGLANDVCHTDPRTDTVNVAPAPGTGERYPMIVLSAAPLPYDEPTTAPMGCVPGDFDEDGKLDLLVYYWGRTPILFIRHGNDFRPEELTTSGERWFTNAATTADLDADGHVDIVIANYFADGARILDDEATEPDSMQDSMSRAFNGGTTRFFLAAPRHGRATFRQIDGVVEEHVSRGWTLALGAMDLDGDLLPELYFANDFGPDRVLHNRSEPGVLNFALLEGSEPPSVPSSKVMGRDSFKGMGVDFGDVNGDGYPDVYISNIAADFSLHESHFLWESTGDVASMKEGHAPYVDNSEPLGVARSSWGWDTRLADFDNDSVLEAVQATGFVKGEVDRWPELQELATGNDELLKNPAVWPRVRPGDDLSGHAPNPFFVRSSSGRFVDVADRVGLGDPKVSRGLATADVDGDGDLDLAVANQWDTSYLFRNDCPGCGAFLGLKLMLPTGELRDSSAVTSIAGQRAPKGTRPAIGAWAAVKLKDGKRLVGQVDGGNGHSGVRSQELHFGLGEQGDEAVEVEVRYRDTSGRPQKAKLSLKPGWHTLILGGAEEGN